MGVFHLSPFALFFALCIGHALCDYPLQGDFLAQAKSHIGGIPGVPWYHALTAHAAIQAGMVWVITLSWELALLEFVCHWCIDRWKAGAFSHTRRAQERTFDLDQLFHVLCKAGWVWILVAVLTR